MTAAPSILPNTNAYQEITIINFKDNQPGNNNSAVVWNTKVQLSVQDEFKRVQQ